MMDFTELTAQDVDALQGPEREAYYAWRTGRPAKVREINEAYGLDIAVEAPERPRDPAIETAEAKRRPGRPRAT